MFDGWLFALLHLAELTEFYNLIIYLFTYLFSPLTPVDSSESSEESVSGFSSSSHGYHSAIGPQVEDTSSVCASTLTAKEAAVAQRAETSAAFHKPNVRAGSPEKTQPLVAPKPKLKARYQSKDLPCGKVQYKPPNQ